MNIIASKKCQGLPVKGFLIFQATISKQFTPKNERKNELI